MNNIKVTTSLGNIPHRLVHFLRRDVRETHRASITSTRYCLAKIVKAMHNMISLCVRLLVQVIGLWVEECPPYTVLRREISIDRTRILKKAHKTVQLMDDFDIASEEARVAV